MSTQSRDLVARPGRGLRLEICRRETVRFRTPNATFRCPYKVAPKKHPKLSRRLCCIDPEFSAALPECPVCQKQKRRCKHAATSQRAEMIFSFRKAPGPYFTKTGSRRTHVCSDGNALYLKVTLMRPQLLQNVTRPSTFEAVCDDLAGRVVLSPTATLLTTAHTLWPIRVTRYCGQRPLGQPPQTFREHRVLGGE